MVQLKQKGSRKERGLSKVEARRYRYALSSYTSLLDNTAILLYGLRKLRRAKGQWYRNSEHGHILKRCHVHGSIEIISCDDLMNLQVNIE